MEFIDPKKWGHDLSTQIDGDSSQNAFAVYHQKRMFKPVYSVITLKVGVFTVSPQIKL